MRAHMIADPAVAVQCQARQVRTVGCAIEHALDALAA
jgi:hypothetical protein